MRSLLRANLKRRSTPSLSIFATYVHFKTLSAAREDTTTALKYGDHRRGGGGGGGCGAGRKLGGAGAGPAKSNPAGIRWGGTRRVRRRCLKSAFMRRRRWRHWWYGGVRGGITWPDLPSPLARTRKINFGASAIKARRAIVQCDETAPRRLHSRRDFSKSFNTRTWSL